MKNCLDQATEILAKSNPSIADAIALAPLAVQEEASIIAAAFFSSTFRDTCITQLTVSKEQIQLWFEPISKETPTITTVDELKNFFKQSNANIIHALSYVLDKSSNSHTLSLIEEVVVAMSITTWINQLGDQPEGFSLLPLDLITEFNLDLDKIVSSQKVPEALARALAVLMGEARQSFVRLYHHLDYFDPSIRLAIYTGVKFHEAILNEIIWAKFELFSAVQAVSSLRRKFITFKAKRAMRKRS